MSRATLTCDYGAMAQSNTKVRHYNADEGSGMEYGVRRGQAGGGRGQRYLRLVGGRAQVRRAHQIGVRDEALQVVLRGLRREHVQRRAGHLPSRKK